MTALLINLAGGLLMLAIVWWFWLYRPSQAAHPESGTIQIKVENGVYSPDRISVPANQPTKLRFLRKDPSACAATVIFDELDISADLPLGEIKEVVVTPTTPGTFSFSCQMQMYRGSLEVKET
jgi:plastocyanin domain-containing protein